MEGNQQKIREVLNDIVGIAKIALNMNSLENSNNSELWRIIDKCKSALSAPARQCDVGTVEEQESRYKRFCDSHKWVDDEGVNACSFDCPLYNASECALRWAQTPHGAQEGSGK